ncbi:MAG TPA: formyltransferase family protein, partial [Trinickia sp.]|nr:formyltransferase family protein [Trinickia sp.]
MKNIVILISGRGSNMQAIVRACAREGWPARVAAVVANRPTAAGLAFAADAGIPAPVVDYLEFPERDAFEAALAAVIDRYEPDLVV